VGGVEALRRRIPAFVWLSQYQQAPVGAGEGVLREDFFTPYEILPELPFETYLSFDLAGGGLGEGNSYSACAVVHRYNHNLYISQIWRGRLDFVALKAKAMQLIQQHPQAPVLVEDAALGPALIGLPAGDRRARGAHPQAQPVETGALAVGVRGVRRGPNLPPRPRALAPGLR
jgi:hypothetical protein